MPQYLSHTPDEFNVGKQGEEEVFVAIHRESGIGGQGRTEKKAIEAAARAVERRLKPVHPSDISEEWEEWEAD